MLDHLIRTVSLNIEIEFYFLMLKIYILLVNSSIISINHELHS